jgi:hypothetical protein
MASAERCTLRLRAQAQARHVHRPAPPPAERDAWVADLWKSTNMSS